MKDVVHECGGYVDDVLFDLEPLKRFETGRCDQFWGSDKCLIERILKLLNTSYLVFRQDEVK